MFRRASARLCAVVLLAMCNLCVARQLTQGAPNIAKKLNESTLLLGADFYHIGIDFYQCVVRMNMNLDFDGPNCTLLGIYPVRCDFWHYTDCSMHCGIDGPGVRCDNRFLPVRCPCPNNCPIICQLIGIDCPDYFW